MEHADLPEQNHSNAAAFSFGDLSAKLPEQGFDVAPLHVRAGRVGEQKFERALVPPLHRRIWYQQQVLRAAALERVLRTVAADYTALSDAELAQRLAAG